MRQVGTQGNPVVLVPLALRIMDLDERIRLLVVLIVPTAVLQDEQVSHLGDVIIVRTWPRHQLSLEVEYETVWQLAVPHLLASLVEVLHDVRLSLTDDLSLIHIKAKKSSGVFGMSHIDIPLRLGVKLFAQSWIDPHKSITPKDTQLIHLIVNSFHDGERNLPVVPGVGHAVLDKVEMPPS